MGLLLRFNTKLQRLRQWRLRIVEEALQLLVIIPVLLVFADMLCRRKVRVLLVLRLLAGRLRWLRHGGRRHRVCLQASPQHTNPMLRSYARC